MVRGEMVTAAMQVVLSVVVAAGVGIVEAAAAGLGLLVWLLQWLPQTRGCMVRHLTIGETNTHRSPKCCLWHCGHVGYSW